MLVSLGLVFRWWQLLLHLRVLTWQLLLHFSLIPFFLLPPMPSSAELEEPHPLLVLFMISPSTQKWCDCFCFSGYDQDRTEERVRERDSGRVSGWGWLSFIATNMLWKLFLSTGKFLHGSMRSVRSCISSLSATSARDLGCT